MKKIFLFSILLCSAMCLQACRGSGNKKDSASENEATAKPVNNDLANFGLKGQVKTQTAVISYTTYSSDNTVMEQKVDSIISSYNQGGNMTGMKFYDPNGTLSFYIVRTEMKNGDWDAKSYTADGQLTNTTTFQRNDKSIVENTHDELSGATTKKTQSLSSEFLVEKSETKYYGRSGNENMTSTEIYLYDTDKNKTKTTTKMANAKGEKTQFDINNSILEKDKYGNPTKTTLKTVTKMGTMEGSSKTTYEYY